MKLLVDTHLLLLAACDPDRLPRQAVGILTDPANDLWFSAVSTWEIASQSARSDAVFDVDASVVRAGLLANGYTELAITGQHCYSVGHAGMFAACPHILIAQAMSEGMVLVTNDPGIARLSPSARYFGS